MILKGITMYPKTRTNKGYQGSGDKLYQSKQWKDFRKNYLTGKPLCRICESKGITRMATVLDHKTPISKGGQVWDERNLQGLCKSCNAIKTALDNPNNDNT